MILLGLFLALYLVAFVVVTSVLRRGLRVPLAIVAPIVWVTLETIRSNIMTGFPYLLLGHTQIDNLTLMQILDVTGVYGVSFIVMSCNGLLAEIALLPGSRAYGPAVVSAPIAVAGLAAAFVYGGARLAGLETRPGPEVCLVQANIPQEVKNQMTPEQRREAMGRYLDLTFACIEKAEGPSPLVIWPESALPGFYDHSTPWMELVRRNVDYVMRSKKIRRFLIGINHFGVEGEKLKILNSAVYLHEGHDTYERYDKIHLVPFGEYVPLPWLLFFVKHVVPYPEPFSAGTEYTLFEYNDHTFGVVICYEDVFPGLVRRFVTRGAEFIVNISNEGWFYESAEADQHLAIARCRAIENRVAVVRCTNSGISCLINPMGLVEKQIEKEGKVKLVEGWLTGRVTLGGVPATVYTRVGDAFALICMGGAVGLIIGAWRAGRRKE
jgi:apolipoprotein N-acyltransferase